jgi:hypothetical protein
MGYWLGQASENEGAGESLTFTVTAPGEAKHAARTDSPPLHPLRSATRPTRTVKVKSPNTGDGDLHLTVGPEGVHVAASEAAWKTLDEPVLLAVCQWWRFAAVDRELDRLTELAVRDLDHATLPSLASYRARNELGKTARLVRAILVDLPHFEGPLTDPYAYCSCERSAQVYESLAEKLGLQEWCELLDERAEAVEDIYGAVTEKLLEYKNFLGQAVLEIIIIVILLAELAVLLWETFAP